MSQKHQYTKEQIDYIRSIAPGIPKKEITIMFNEKFGTNVTQRSIEGIMYRNGIKNRMQGYTSRFEKGQKAWNKGLKGLNLGGEAGWFKKGNTNKRLPLLSESVQEGWVYIKVKHPDVWVKKHRWLWEQHYGEIPKGKVVTFKDGNKQNVTIENLFLTTKGARSAVVRRGLPEDIPELKIVSHRLAELDIAIKNRR